MSAAQKLDEARFFLELLHALEVRGSTLTNNASAAEEASYLFSAILNSFYSVIAILQESGIDVRSFKKEHVEIYGRITDRGVRAMTVHKEHVPMGLSGYVPPVRKVDLWFRRKPKLVSSPQPGRSSVNFKVTERHYVLLPRNWSLVNALDYCEDHYQALAAFVQSGAGNATQQGTAADPASLGG